MDQNGSKRKLGALLFVARAGGTGQMQKARIVPLLRSAEVFVQSVVRISNTFQQVRYLCSATAES